MFEVAESYEVMMGRWSRHLAPLFVEFVGGRDGEKVLDVGCGTGALSSTLASMTRAAKIVGIDPSAAFIQAARSQITDPRVTIELGDAQNLPYADASFDRCLALLIVNFIPDAPKAAKEMRRVRIQVAWSRPQCGTAAVLMSFKTACGMAIAIDPTVKRSSGGRSRRFCGRAFRSIEGAGLTEIELQTCDAVRFASFDEFWQRYLGG